MNKLKSDFKVLNEDDILWNHLRNGDEQAFSELFEKYFGTLLNYGKTLAADKSMIKDCVQDVFTDLWLYKSKLNDKVVVKSYLLACLRKRIARVHERDHIFGQRKGLENMEFLMDFTIEDQLISDENMALKVAKLNNYINLLPPRQKEALYLRYHQNLPIDEVAKILNLNYQSVKNLLHKAVLQLRKGFSTVTLLLIYYDLLLK